MEKNTHLKIDHTSTANARPVRSRDEKGITDFKPFRGVAGAVAIKLGLDMEMERQNAEDRTRFVVVMEVDRSLVVVYKLPLTPVSLIT